MINKEKREYIVNELEIESVFFDNPSFDNSIIGVTNDGKLVYDYELMIEELSIDDDMSDIDAMEFIDYNTMRTIPYIDEEIRPVILYSFTEDFNNEDR